MTANEETIMKFINKLLRDEAGATAIEYGLIAAATGIALGAIMPSIGTKLETGALKQISDGWNTGG